jgi:hypothetical protein
MNTLSTGQVSYTKQSVTLLSWQVRDSQSVCLCDSAQLRARAVCCLFLCDNIHQGCLKAL